MASVRFAGVTKRFGSVVAVDQLDLAVEDGEFLALVGPSGCGKTTALRMVAGLEEPSAGAIWIGERDVTYDEPKDRDIGMVFQNYALYPHMTVFDNLAFSLRRRKTPKGEVETRVRAVADLLELGGLLARRPRELSGGQRQRVALGRAIVRRPRVYLMDEPLSNLDAQLRAQTRAELVRLHRQLGTTTIYVTHDQVEAMTMGTRIAVLEEGRLHQVAPPQQLYDAPTNAFVARFIGSPPMNLLAGEPNGDRRVRAGDVSLDVGPLPPAAPRSLLVGFRPEHARLTGADTGRLSGVIDLIERLGSDALVTVRTAAGPVIVRADARVPAVLGDRVRLAVAPEHCHLFDAASGNRLDRTLAPLSV